MDSKFSGFWLVVFCVIEDLGVAVEISQVSLFSTQILYQVSHSWTRYIVLLVQRPLHTQFRIHIYIPPCSLVQKVSIMSNNLQKSVGTEVWHIIRRYTDMFDFRLPGPPFSTVQVEDDSGECWNLVHWVGLHQKRGYSHLNYVRMSLQTEVTLTGSKTTLFTGSALSFPGLSRCGKYLYARKVHQNIWNWTLGV